MPDEKKARRGFGSLFKRKNGKWLVRYPDPNGKRYANGRAHIRFDHNVNMVRSHVHGVEHPATVGGVLPDRFENHGTFFGAQRDRRMLGQVPLEPLPFWAFVQQPCMRLIVETVDGSVLVAVESRTVAGKGDEIRPGTAAGSRRLVALTQRRFQYRWSNRRKNRARNASDG